MPSAAEIINAIMEPAHISMNTGWRFCITLSITWKDLINSLSPKLLIPGMTTIAKASKNPAVNEQRNVVMIRMVWNRSKVNSP
jgi:hypothetical protein